MSHGSVRFTREGVVARVALNRPEVRNAFNDEMIEDLLEVFAEIRDDRDIRAVVLTGEGRVFCAGADVHWMKRVLDYSYEKNYEDSLTLARMLREIFTCPKPVVGCISGAAIGGGTGLVAVCDIAIAADDTVFAFTETRLGLSPATISPYLLKRMGERNVREYFLTGERFTAARAAAMGLVNAVVRPKELDAAVDEKVGMMLKNGPEALAVSKDLIREIAQRTLEDNGPYTAGVIAKMRVSEEGQEGMNAFLEKRKPRWITDVDESSAR